ncbi:MAG: hypothetical protein ACOCP8_03035 [archaeon]
MFESILKFIAVWVGKFLDIRAANKVEKKIIILIVIKKIYILINQRILKNKNISKLNVVIVNKK